MSPIEVNKRADQQNSKMGVNQNNDFIADFKVMQATPYVFNL